MQSTEAGVKTQKKLSIQLVYVLIIAAVLLSGTISGMICWREATKAAEERARAERQTYMEENSISRSLTYQRLTDSWTKTLSDVYGDVIFFGDSITAGGLWEEYYPYLTPVNLGVVGDTVDGLLTRLPQIEMLMCEKCFVMIGVNDLAFHNTVEAKVRNASERACYYER